MAGFVEILQVQSVIPYLIHCCALKHRFAHFELDYQNSRPDKQYRVDSTAHAWNVELEKQRTRQTKEAVLQEPNLRDPSIPLSRQQSKTTISC
jgi:hypothetical protein